MTERIHASLQENIITLLAYSDEYGKVVCNVVTPDMFTGEYQVIAERALAYWRQYAEAPKDHLGDLFTDILGEGGRRAPAFQRIMLSMFRLSDGINGKYVLDKVTRHIRMAKIQTALLDTVNDLNARDDMAIEDIEALWYKLLRTKETSFDPGITLLDYDKMIKAREKNTNEFMTGIPVFNNRGIRPSRGTLTMFLAPPGEGKSWFLTDIGKRNVLLRKKVLHITLELDDTKLLQRYYQSMFSISEKRSDVELTEFEQDADHNITGLKFKKVKPDFSLDSPILNEELDSRLVAFGHRMASVYIKQFPMYSLTIGELNALLDSLEIHQNFIPDLLLLDAPYLMKIDTGNHRLDLGRTVAQVRGIATERNIAVVATHQINRQGSEKRRITKADIADDWTIVMTADNILIQSRTKMEKRLRLARVFCEKARDVADGFGALITQNYEVGQYVLRSAFLTGAYWDFLDEQKKHDSGEGTEGEKSDDGVLKND